MALLIPHCAWVAVIMLAGLLLPALVLGGMESIQPLAWLIAGSFALLTFFAMLATLRRKGLALARFVTLVPVIVLVAFILRVAAPAMDMKYSARPLAAEIARLETKPAELAVFEAPRDVEYGLAFYRNQVVRRYERGEIPAGDHLVVAREGVRAKLEQMVPGRRVSYVGNYPARKLELFWVSNPGPGH